jgi:hypothetical protein
MDPAVNPFAALSLIAAPAILTNASAVLAMSTSNRLARAVDRGRELLRLAESDGNTPERERRLYDLGVAEQRSVLLLRVLRSFYIALAAFALATLVSLIGATVATAAPAMAVRVIELLGLGSGVIGVGALMHGAVLLVRETRLAVTALQERVAQGRAQLAANGRS